FQAEDGIRDFHVTGVQTCALPISVRTVARVLQLVPGQPIHDPHHRAVPGTHQAPPAGRSAVMTLSILSLVVGLSLAGTILFLVRSEERRVGNEWVCRQLEPSKRER